MPKVKIDNTKGISSETGSGLEISSGTTFKADVVFTDSIKLGGHIDHVSNIKDVATPGSTALSFNGGARIMLSGSHSSKTWILDDHANDYKVVIPAIVGWNAKFILTGSGNAAVLSNDVFLSASSGFTVTAGTQVFRGFVLRTSASAGTVLGSGSAGVSSTITCPDQTAGNLGRVKFTEDFDGGVRAGDMAEVEVVSTNPGVILVRGVARN